jgi:plasmid stability protein
MLTCAQHATTLIAMGKMIQLRNVPDELHRTLKARAALAGMSLSDYLLREIRKAAARPSQEELLRRLQSRSAPALDVRPAAALRAERERR